MTYKTVGRALEPLEQLSSVLRKQALTGNTHRSFFYSSWQALLHSQEILITTVTTLLSALSLSPRSPVAPLLWHGLRLLFKRGELTLSQLTAKHTNSSTSGNLAMFTKSLTQALCLVLDTLGNQELSTEQERCGMLLLTLGYFHFPCVSPTFSSVVAETDPELDAAGTRDTRQSRAYDGPR